MEPHKAWLAFNRWFYTCSAQYFADIPNVLVNCENSYNNVYCRVNIIPADNQIASATRGPAGIFFFIQYICLKYWNILAPTSVKWNAAQCPLELHRLWHIVYSQWWCDFWQRGYMYKQVHKAATLLMVRYITISHGICRDWNKRAECFILLSRQINTWNVAQV